MKKITKYLMAFAATALTATAVTAGVQAVEGNAKAPEAAQQATLDFLYWCVTSETGLKTLSAIGDIPFKSAPESANGFSKAGADLLANGNYAVTWAFNLTPNTDSWRATVVTALAAYSADQSDANWDAVVSAFVDGWAYEYGVVTG